jgi:hypothetical protein
MSAPTKQELIALLEFEIGRVDQDRREQGWTLWLLAVALAALGWTAFGSVLEVSDWSRMWVFWAIFVLAVDFLRSLHSLVGRDVTPPQTQQPPRFFSTLRLLGATRPFLLYTLVTIGAAAFIIYASGYLDGWMRMIWAFVYGLSMIGFGCLIVLSLIDQPIAIGGRSRGLRSGVGLAVTATEFVGILLLVLAVFPEALGRFQLAEARLGLLLFAAVEVARLYFSLSPYDAMRNRLQQLRRAIALGELSEAEATRRVEIAIHGVAHATVTRERIEKCSLAWDRYTEAAERLCAEQRLFAERLRLNPAVDVARNEFDALDRKAKEVKSLFGDAEVAHGKFQAQHLLEGGKSDPLLESAAAAFKSRSVEAEALEKRRVELIDTLERDFNEFVARRRREQGDVL